MALWQIFKNVQYERRNFSSNFSIFTLVLRQIFINVQYERRLWLCTRRVGSIPPRSPNFSLCNFFLWGDAKGQVFVPPLPTNIEKMKQRITAALETVTEDMLQRVWHELEYRLYVCKVTGDAHIEHFWKSVIEPTNICTFLCKFNQ